jgi:hypothetical protein
MTEAQQEEIKLILKNNDFLRRFRIGRGPALTQGLLRCAMQEIIECELSARSKLQLCVRMEH